MKFTSAAISLVAFAGSAVAFAPAPRTSTFAPSSTALNEVDAMSFDFVPVRKKAPVKVQVKKTVAPPKPAVEEPAPFFLDEGRAAPSAVDITPKEVRALFSLWNNALATGDSRLVASRYATKSGAILLPTVSDTPRTDYDSIKDYFDGFLKKAPQGEILEGNIRIGNGWCQDAG